MLAFVIFVSPGVIAQSPTPAVPDEDVASGVAQVKKGDHEHGLVTLEAAVKKLGPAKAKASDVAMAHLFMGVAHANLGHAQQAKDSFREALKLDKALRLDNTFPPPVIEAFEEARKSGAQQKKVVVGGAIVAGAVATAIIAGGGSSTGTSASGAGPGSSGGSPTTGATPSPPLCPDNVAPQVTLIAPGPGAALSGTIVLRATATDNVGVTELRFFVDDRLIGLASAGGSDLPWDTRTVSNGNHQVQARAFDACQNQGFSQPALVTVRN